MFNRVGVITYPKAKGSDDAMLELAIEAGADECISADESHEFISSIEAFGEVRDALEEKLGPAQSAKIEFRAQTMTAVSDENGETLVKLLDTLEDHDDVQTVYGNYELSDALIAKLAA
jgi:transcriptional/translational regulatory protein YebC/TACO1